MSKCIAALLLLVSIGCAGCGGSRAPVQVSPDTYIISKRGGCGAFDDLSAMKADLYREANEFAANQGKVAIPLTVNEHPWAGGVTFSSVELQFRVVDKSDPEARRTHMVPRPDLVIQKDENIKKEEIIKKDEHVTSDTHSKVESDKGVDLYTELMKLDDLRKRGLLTEEEFQEQKRKLLESKK